MDCTIVVPFSHCSGVGFYVGGSSGIDYIILQLHYGDNLDHLQGKSHSWKYVSVQSPSFTEFNPFLCCKSRSHSKLCPTFSKSTSFPNILWCALVWFHSECLISTFWQVYRCETQLMARISLQNTSVFR